MIKSMTGFGRAQAEKDGYAITVEIKTVNHRYNDIFIRMPRHMTFMEERVRNEILRRIARGKIDAYITFEETKDAPKTVSCDFELIKAYMEAFDVLKNQYGVKDDIGLSLFAKIPDVFTVKKQETDENVLWSILKPVLDEALNCVVLMREKEGKELKLDLLQKCNYIENMIEEISKRAPCVVTDYKNRLEARIKELVQQQNIDEYRIATEVAIFADRCSIDEEIVRLKSHIEQVRHTLEMCQPVGRKLDFLIQEMNREINTIGSKANDIFITRIVVDLKSEIEKLREQVQNIE